VRLCARHSFAICVVICEGQDVAHVLYKSAAITFDLAADVIRMPLRYADGRWRILLTGELDE
jgi:hypothetical protein